ncbi:MAG TPA: hypothetical protein VJZ74_10050, partial [Pseudolabrys sp.]|nr:hypothetical protein [Pseudolabrys sp.]
SAAPWITVAAGLIVLAPHLVWLYRNDFAPFGYAVGIHGAKPFAVALKAALGYFAGSFGYVAIPLIVLLAAVRPNRAALADMAWPRERERRLAAVAFWAPFLLPALGALASGTEITSLWSMPAWTLLPVLLLSQPSVTVAAVDTRRILIAALALPLLMLLASPLIAVMAQRAGPQPAAAHARLLATEIERAWHAMTPLPLRFVGGDAEITYGVVAAAASRPRALPNMPQPSEAELRRSGVVLVCFAEDAECSRAAARVPASRGIETAIVRSYLGLPGAPRRYSIAIVPPQP